jgi:hypothetical protein
LPAASARAEAEQPPPAEDKSSERFGDARKLVIAGDFAFSLDRQRYEENASRTSVQVSPSVDYFLIDHLSVGTGVSIARTWSSWYGDDSTSTAIALGPRVGYEVPLGNAVSFWPTVGVSYSRFIRSDSLPFNDTWFLSAYVRAPLVAHVAKHFFIGGGPSFGVDLTDSQQSDTHRYGFGVNSMLGGWL